MKKELEILSGFESISLPEMDGVELMDRRDTKFVMSRDEFRSILLALEGEYQVLEIQGDRCTPYENLYFDGPDFVFYHEHQRGKKNRMKLRMRKYANSDLSFLEVKLKNNKNRTVKHRMEIEDIHHDFSQEDIAFLKESVENIENLQPTLFNYFNRVTLVHRKNEERLTFDMDLRFEKLNGEEQLINEVVIAELKQGRFNRESTFAQLAKQLQIRPTRLSKYCLGIALLNENVKKNRMKGKLRFLKKLFPNLAA